MGKKIEKHVGKTYQEVFYVEAEEEKKKMGCLTQIGIIAIIFFVIFMVAALSSETGLFTSFFAIIIAFLIKLFQLVLVIGVIFIAIKIFKRFK